VGALENKTNAALFIEEVINKGNMSVADSYIAPNIVDHQLESQPGLPGGVAGFEAFMSMFRRAFPDLHYTVEDVIVEGDKVVQRTTARGTMKGDFMGMPASGKTANWEEIHISRFADGKIVEHWAVVDQVAMLTQLGFIDQQARASARR
jgi:steroid delta-isomerase-like uncharacterized protein